MLKKILNESRGEAQPVDADVMMFHDWRFVYAGYPPWVVPAGVEDGMHIEANLPDTPGILNAKRGDLMDKPLQWSTRDLPLGIRLEAQKPTLIERDPVANWIVQDGGMYKSWYKLEIPPEHGKYAMCYAESADGLTWTKPDLGLISIPGVEERNIVHICPQGVGNLVFIDPDCDPSERYKTLFLGHATPEQEQAYREKYPDEIDDLCYRAGIIWALLGAVSPDGLHWHDLELPLLLQQSDTENVCYYDAENKRYVAYLRMRYQQRRAIGYSMTSDFRHFSPPEMMTWMTGDYEATHQIYGPFGRSMYPGTSEYHMMFPLMWQVEDDQFYTHMATSVDGRYWSMLPPGAIIGPGHYGEPTGGGILASGNLIELTDNRIGLPVHGYSMPHKYPFRPSHPKGADLWAIWPKDRLVALVADGDGQFRTQLISFNGDQIRINCRTKHTGFIRIEITDNKDVPLPGRSFDDSDPIIGDFTDRTVSWKGQPNIGRAPDQPIKIRLKLHAAELFSIRFS